MGARALELETVEVRAEFEGDTVARLAAEKPNLAKNLIEDFMIAATSVRGFSPIERWHDECECLSR